MYSIAFRHSKDIPGKGKSTVVLFDFAPVLIVQSSVRFRNEPSDSVPSLQCPVAVPPQRKVRISLRVLCVEPDF